MWGQVVNENVIMVIMLSLHLACPTLNANCFSSHIVAVSRAWVPEGISLFQGASEIGFHEEQGWDGSREDQEAGGPRRVRHQGAGGALFPQEIPSHEEALLWARKIIKHMDSSILFFRGEMLPVAKVLGQWAEVSQSRLQHYLTFTAVDLRRSFFWSMGNTFQCMRQQQSVTFISLSQHFGYLPLENSIQHILAGQRKCKIHLQGVPKRDDFLIGITTKCTILNELYLKFIVLYHKCYGSIIGFSSEKLFGPMENVHSDDLLLILWNGECILHIVSVYICTYMVKCLGGLWASCSCEVSDGEQQSVSYECVYKVALSCVVINY